MIPTGSSLWRVPVFLCLSSLWLCHHASAFGSPPPLPPIVASNILLSSPLFTPISSTSRGGDPSSTEVIAAAQKVMANTGYFDPMEDESLFADDFIFRGPVIGPLNKADYQEVLNYFSIYKAFPDISPNCFGYTQDPDNPYRVWFMVRATGTYQYRLGGPLGSLLPPDQRMYRGSPETWSLTFCRNSNNNNNLQVRLMTAGYVSDRFDDEATTDGKGLSFGILKTLGISLPSGVGDTGLRLVQAVNGPLVGAGLAPKAVSDKQDIPSWWSNEKRGADP